MERKKQDINKIDPSLDTPSEANTQKHINFLAEEENSTTENRDRDRDEFSEERKK